MNKPHNYLKESQRAIARYDVSNLVDVHSWKFENGCDVRIHRSNQSTWFLKRYDTC
ncbi:hypothetical protein KSD_06010 [Ktedonobacter sp. SOSP1-85]|nr:hypothetical protein KSD_06010 [Ktedonobacter sp. SOSP1-85]